MKKGNVTLFRVETFKKNDELGLKLAYIIAIKQHSNILIVQPSLLDIQITDT